MTSHDRRPDSDSAAATPDIGFKAGFGFYLGVIVAGVTALAAVAADATTATILATTPSTVVAALLLALVFGDRLAGLPERLGASRRRRLTWYLPAAGFGAVLLAPAVTALEFSARLTVTSIAFTSLSGTVALGVAQMARHRYIDAVTPDEPLIAWPWHRTSFDSGLRGTVILGFAVVALVFGLGSFAVGDGTNGWFLIYAIVPLLMWLSDRYGWGWSHREATDEDSRWGNVDLEAYENGLLVDRFERRLVPWDRIGDVRLTEDELVVERRRWFDVRCDRSAIDDPESVRAELERLREGAGAGGDDSGGAGTGDSDGTYQRENSRTPSTEAN